jgi:hypothetical protein
MNMRLELARDIIAVGSKNDVDTERDVPLGIK